MRSSLRRFSRTIWLCGFFVCAVSPGVWASSMGRIKGTVKSGEGTPVQGAVVALLSPGELVKPGSPNPASVLASAITDKRGHFVTANVRPGRYSIYVSASGYASAHLPQVEIKPDNAMSYHFELRKTARLVDQAKGDEEYKYVVRASRRYVLRLNEEEPDIAGESGDENSAGAFVALTEDKRRPHGLIRFSTYSTNYLGGESGLSYGADFALRERFGRNVEEVIVGQMGTGESSPALLASVTNVQVGERHALQLSMGYGRGFLRTFAKDHEGSLDEFALAATDRYRVFGPTILIFGFEYSRYSDAGTSAAFFEPRLGIQFDAPQGLRLSAQLMPGDSSRVSDTEQTENGEVSFEKVAAVPSSSDGRPIAGRSRRAQVSVEKTIDDRSTIEAAVFYDTVTGHGVGVLAVPTNTSVSLVGATVENLSGPLRGSRAVYSRRFNSHVTGQFGYAYGQGESVSAEGLQHPSRMFARNSFHVAVAKVDVDLHTGAQISTTFRFSPSGVTFAIDPFMGSMKTFSPGLGIYLAQPIPSFGILPGKWVGSLDVNNLLDQHASVQGPSGRLLLWNAQRTVRGAISVRF